MHTVTVDELSYRLKRAARKLAMDRREKLAHERMPLPGKLPKRSDVASALEYVNRRFCVGIHSLGDDHLKEDARACILHDLANQPLEMVMQRLRSEGAWVE